MIREADRQEATVKYYTVQRTEHLIYVSLRPFSFRFKQILRLLLSLPLSSTVQMVFLPGILDTITASSSL